MKEILKRPIIFSALAHLLLAMMIILLPSLRFGLIDRSLEVTWVELPRGASEEIGSGVIKTETLPRSTIQEQKAPPPPAAKKEPEMKVQTKEKPPEKKVAKKEPPKKLLSAVDRKIQEALAKNEQALKERTAPPEAAQVREENESYKYGTGSTPLKVSPSDPEYLKYQAEVRMRIIDQWIIPPSYAEDGSDVNFNARVGVLIHDSGEVSSIQWISKSGNAAFDASAIRAVKRASPLPKPPERLAWEAYNEGFLIEFDPKLKP